MPCFVRLEDAAAALSTTVNTLEDLKRWGWIGIVEKDGQRYIHGSDQSRAGFVLAVRRHLALAPGQVTALLARERPPYSEKKVLEIAESFRTGTGNGERNPW